MVRPKKHLGQHFLTEKKIAERITEHLRASDYNELIEIGPGKGILTEFLLQRTGINLHAIEIDQEAYDYLVKRWPDKQHLLVKADFLALNVGKEFPAKFGIIGNFPYNISSQIFFKVLENKENCREVVCMIQKEVAERIIAPPGSRTYGILSVLLQTWYDLEYLFTVNPGSFFPPPEVKSAVIRLSRNSRTELPVDPQFFTLIVKTAFNQRRKMLRNSIKQFMGMINPDDPILQKRPEQLGVEEFIYLAKNLSKVK